MKNVQAGDAIDFLSSGKMSYRQTFNLKSLLRCTPRASFSIFLYTNKEIPKTDWFYFFGRENVENFEIDYFLLGMALPVHYI